MASPVRSARMPASRRRWFGVVLALCAHLALLVIFADVVVAALVGLATPSRAGRLTVFVVLEMVLALACLALWPALRRRGSEFVWGVVLGWIASFVAILCLTLVWILTVVNLTAESVASGQT